MTVSEKFTADLFSDELSPLALAIETLASQGGIEARGAFYTRPEVVDFMLDLSGYTDDQPIYNLRILEPSCGGGSFLFPVVERLLSAWRKAHTCSPRFENLVNAVRAVELHRETFLETRIGVIARLVQSGIGASDAEALVTRWVRQEDYLLSDLDGEFDFVVGNPPYVRQELIPAVLLAEYRVRYQTLYDRADLYVPFIERSLKKLAKGGKLTFICADRWMKNRYGGPLRRMISSNFHLKYYIDMYDTPAFFTDVVAYPAITIISKEKPGATRIAHRPAINTDELKSLSDQLRSESLQDGVKELIGVVAGAEPWLLESSDQTAIVRRLEESLPSLEQAGCKVGIGVATGADKAFIGDYDQLDVEPDRKVPLVTTRDIRSGEVVWTGQGVINPYRDEGGLVDLDDFPRLNQYLNRHRDVIARRHCAQKTPGSWYKTIDRITPSIALKPKLLIPDIKGEAHIVYEEGKLYPHHNLYYVTSEQWDLRALQAVLLSAVTRLFIATYSTKMRGGFLRFQAQYLRRIRLPMWDSVSSSLREELKVAGISRDVSACNEAVFELYCMTAEERSVLGGTN
jgi:hypothetical protein